MPDDGGKKIDSNFYDQQQHRPPGMEPGGGPQQPGTWARAARMIAAAFPVTVGLSAAVLVADYLLPEGIKPSHVMGVFLGNIHATEVETQQPAVVGNTYRMADAQAKANADYQARLIAYQRQIEAAQEALKGKIGMANAADIACVGAQVAMAWFGPYSQGGQNARAVAAASCSTAERLRQEIAEEQARIAQTYNILMLGGR